MKASKEQIRSLSEQEEFPARIWPFGDSSGPFNLFRRRPSQSNQFGRLYEAHPNDFKQLQDLDLIVSFANITKVSKTCSFHFLFLPSVIFFVPYHCCLTAIVVTINLFLMRCI